MDEKRTLDEILAIYAFEPGLKDIFLEGRADKNFIEWYLRANGVRDVSVYPIDLIDIPNEIITKHGFTPKSNRSRVLALACELVSVTMPVCRFCVSPTGITRITDRVYERTAIWSSQTVTHLICTPLPRPR